MQGRQSVRSREHLRRRLVTVGIAVTLAASALVAGVGVPAGGAPARVKNADPGISKDEIVIGSVDSLSGASAFIAKGGILAREALFDEINSQGGINGRKIKSIAADGGDFTDAIALQAAVTKLKDEAFAINGGDGTLTAPLAKRFKLPTFVPFSTKQAVKDNKYAFPQMTSHAYQAEKLLPDYLLNELDAKGKKIAVIYQAQTFLGEANTAFLKAAKKKGLDVVIDQPVDGAAPTCTQEVANVKAANPDIVVAFVLAATPCVLREGQSQDLKATWTGIGITYGVNVFLSFVPGYLEGMTMLGVNPTFDHPCAQEYKDLVTKRLPDHPELLTDQQALGAYMGYRQMVMRLEQAGKNPTREGLVKKLSNGKVFDDGCLPPVKYGPGDKREGATSAMVWVDKNNEWTVQDPTYRSKF